ncbi:MAG: serine/threonine protein kinase [Gemmataceae bacterium]|nr:serine/threonine protein kinase [Gemmataceae bacterium]
MSEEQSVVDPIGQLAEEFVARYRKGERPALAEYISRCPEQAERIRQLFPMLVLMEGAAPDSAPDATRDPSGGNGGAVPPKLERVGGYRILREIGRSMAVVYEAEQVALGRHVALKVLPLHAAQNPRMLERFQREARAAARLHHTNIVPVHEVGQDGEVCYYTMQYIAGQPLDQVIDELRQLRGQGTARPRDGSVAHSLLSGPAGAPAALASSVSLPGQTDPSSVQSNREHYFRSVARVGVQVAQALAYAHQEGVIHRDIKPSNLLLDLEGRVWVADFGLAKTAGEGLTQTGEFVGTLRYMAPERFRGEADARSDVYSLGLTLYELLTLKPAFEAPDQARLIQQVLHDEPAPLRQVDPSIPRDLATIVEKASHKEAARRYQGAAALADDLQRFLDDRPIRARRTSVAERCWRWCKRNPAVASLSAAIGLVLVLGLAGMTSQWLRAEEHAERAQGHADRADRERLRLLHINYALRMSQAKQAWDDGGVARALELLEQTRPRPGEPDLRGFEWHLLHRLTHLGVRTFPGHEDRVLCVAFDPQGQRVASSSMDGSVKIWETRTGRLLREFRGDPFNAVWKVAFSPDGKWLAGSGYQDKALKVWDADTGKVRFDLPLDVAGVTGVAFSADGKYLASCSGDFFRSDRLAEVRVWDGASGKLAWSWKCTGTIYSVAFSPNGKRLVAGFRLGPPAKRGAGMVRSWEADTGKELRTWELEVGVRCVAYRPDGQQLAGACTDSKVRLWDADTGQQTRELTGHALAVECVAYSADGKSVAACSWDQTVRVSDVESGELRRTLRGHVGSVMSMASSPDGQHLASGGDDRTVKVWEARSGQDLNALPRATTWAARLAVHPDGRQVATGPGKAPQVWDLQTGGLVGTLEGVGGWLTALVYSPDGRLLAGAWAAGKVRVWDARTRETRCTFEIGPGKGALWCLAFSPDSKRLAGGMGHGFVGVWDAQTGQELLTLPGVGVPVTGVAFSPDGRHLASVSWAERVLVWDVQTRKEVSAFTGHFGNLLSVAWSADGKWLASGGRDNTARVWDAATGKAVFTLKGHARAVVSVSFSPDGSRLASGSEDGTVKVWDLRSGELALTLRESAGAVHQVAFSTDGQRLFSVAEGQPVRIWDATPLPEERAKGGQ